MSDESEPPPEPVQLVKPHQFPVPNLRLPWTGTGVPESLAALPAEQAAIGSREVLRLRADLAEGRSTRFVTAALDAVYQRLVSWRHGLAVEEHHLDPVAADPEWFLSPVSPDDAGNIARYGAVHPLSDEPGPAARTSMAIDAVIRARHRVREPAVQHAEAPLVLRNLVRLGDGTVVPSNCVVLGGRETWRWAPGADGRIPTRHDPYDTAYDRRSVVVPAPLDTEHVLHEAAMSQLAQMLVDPDTTQIQRRFATVAYLLFHAPLYRCGSGDVINVFLAVIGHLLFASAVFLPHDIEAQAQVRPQSDIADVVGFVNWFAARLPPALPRRQRNRRLGSPNPPPGPPVRPGGVAAAMVTARRNAATDDKPPRRRASQPPAAAPAGGGGQSGAGSGSNDMAMMLGPLMYLMFAASQTSQYSSPAIDRKLDHAAEVVESWF